jgi:hypothetical protein
VRDTLLSINARSSDEDIYTDEDIFEGGVSVNDDHLHPMSACSNGIPSDQNYSSDSNNGNASEPTGSPQRDTNHDTHFEDVHSENSHARYETDSNASFHSYSSLGSSTASESDAERDFRIRDMLRVWALTHGITFHALTSLLKILVDCGHDLPRDARTLMKTPRSVQIQNVGGGLYHHFGLGEGLVRILHLYAQLESPLSVQINIDGLPVHKSTNHQFWPIMGLVFGTATPFIIGLFESQTKPTPDFLNEFVEEFINLSQTGINMNGQIFAITLHSFICDAPARSMIKGVVNHNSYNGCERCQCRGVWNGRMTFLDLNSRPRQNDEFLEYDVHFVAPTPLTRMNAQMVNSFVLDYMHLVLLGVTKKLIHVWTAGGRGLPQRVKMGPVCKAEVNAFLSSLSDYIPSDFSRIPRSLDRVKFFKATEYRQLTLYTGIVAFRFMEPDIYQHFLLYHVAISILCDAEFHVQHAFARDLLRKFVEVSKELYGEQFIVYNIHNLIHLADDVQNHDCCLDHIAAFPFENHMRILKRFCRKTSAPLTQIVKRYLEGAFDILRAKKRSDTPKLSKSHQRGPIVAGINVIQQFSKIELTTTILRADGYKDNHVLINNRVALIRNILLDDLGGIHVVYSTYRILRNFYDYPLPSERIGIYVASRLSTNLHCVPLHAITRKYCAIPLSTGRQLRDDRKVVLPLRHLKL